MISKLRAFVAMVFAILAIGAVTVPAARAEGTFEAEEYPAQITGEQTDAFEFTIPEVGAVICEVAAFGGELAGSSSSLEVAPSFSSCALGSLPAFIETNGCTFVYHDAETTEEEFEAEMDVACPENAAIEFHVPLVGCLLTVAAQVDLRDIRTQLTFFPPALHVHSKLGEIHATLEDTPGKECFFGNSTFVMEIGGDAQFSADNEVGEAIGLTLSD